MEPAARVMAIIVTVKICLLLPLLRAIDHITLASTRRAKPWYLARK